MDADQEEEEENLNKLNKLKELNNLKMLERNITEKPYRMRRRHGEDDAVNVDEHDNHRKPDVMRKTKNSTKAKSNTTNSTTKSSILSETFGVTASRNGKNRMDSDHVSNSKSNVVVGVDKVVDAKEPVSSSKVESSNAQKNKVSKSVPVNDASKHIAQFSHSNGNVIINKDISLLSEIDNNEDNKMDSTEDNQNAPSASASVSSDIKPNVAEQSKSPLLLKITVAGINKYEEPIYKSSVEDNDKEGKEKEKEEEEEEFHDACEELSEDTHDGNDDNIGSDGTNKNENEDNKNNKDKVKNKEGNVEVKDDETFHAKCTNNHEEEKMRVEMINMVSHKKDHVKMERPTNEEGKKGKKRIWDENKVVRGDKEKGKDGNNDDDDKGKEKEKETDDNGDEEGKRNKDKDKEGDNNNGKENSSGKNGNEEDWDTRISRSLKKERKKDNNKRRWSLHCQCDMHKYAL